MQCCDNDYRQKMSELEVLLRESHFHRKQSRRVLKDRVLHAESEVQHLRQTVEALSLRLEEGKSKCHSLEALLEQVKSSHAADMIIREQQILHRERDLDIRLEALSVKNEECESRLRSLKNQEEGLLKREEQLRTRQATLEAGFVSAHKQAELEKLWSQRTREQADELLEDARCATVAVKRRKIELDVFYNKQKQFFDLEKEEWSERLLIWRQEIDSLLYLLSLRMGHVVVAEMKAFEEFRMHECDLSSRNDLLALREKEFLSRQHREQYRLNEEKEKVFAVKDSLHRECNLILEKVRLLGVDSFLDTEQSQLDRLKDLEKLLSL